MAWTSGFFNSVNGDRLYNADQMSSIFEGLITNGVYESVGNKLAVQPSDGMVIRIATGRGWFNKRWVNNDAPYLMTVASPDVLLNRYAAVVIRVDTTNGVRTTTPYLKYSEFASTPVKPTMTRSTTVNEYCLAYVYIRAGATSITAADIEDTRANTSLCGWVTGLITQLSTTTLFEQYEAIFNGFLTTETEDFNEWFEGLQVTLDGDVATKLTNALPTSVVATLSSSGWTSINGVWTQNVNVINMNTTKSVVVQANDETIEAFTRAGIKCVAQSTNTLTFTATTQPSVNILVNVLHMGV